MGTEKQSFIRNRNWQKARLVGSVIDKRFLTEEERVIISQIANLKNKLLSNWDVNSKKLGFKIIRCDLYVKEAVDDEEFTLWRQGITIEEAKLLTEPIDSNDIKIVKYEV